MAKKRGCYNCKGKGYLWKYNGLIGQCPVCLGSGRKDKFVFKK